MLQALLVKKAKKLQALMMNKVTLLLKKVNKVTLLLKKVNKVTLLLKKVQLLKR